MHAPMESTYRDRRSQPDDGFVERMAKSAGAR